MSTDHLIVEQLRPPQRAARPPRGLLVSGRASILARGDGSHADSHIEIAGVVLANLDAQHLAKVTAIAEHVSEIVTGYKSGPLEVVETMDRARNTCPSFRWRPVFATGRQEGACGACRSLPSRNA